METSLWIITVPVKQSSAQCEIGLPFVAPRSLLFHFVWTVSWGTFREQVTICRRLRTCNVLPSFCIDTSTAFRPRERF